MIATPDDQLTVEQALELLHPGYPQDPEAETPRIVVHTYLGAMGADWDRDEAVEEIKAHPDSLRRVPSETVAAATGHGLVILNYTERGTPLFFETREKP